jgi:hypothetical protein
MRRFGGPDKRLRSKGQGRQNVGAVSRGSGAQRLT